jgi:hypothetical protein
MEELLSEEFHDLYYSANTIYQINKNEMGGSCGTYVGNKRQIYMQGFGGET